VRQQSGRLFELAGLPAPSAIGGHAASAISPAGDTDPLNPSVVAVKAKRYGALDGMRGVAALAVVMGHASIFYHGGKPGSSALAVDFFFVLAGSFFPEVTTPDFSVA
jgi:uncharacterized membrane protein